MKRSIQQSILGRIKGKMRNKCFARGDFSDLGSRLAVSQALSRLERSGTLVSPLHGYYCCPKVSKLLGERLPTDYGCLAEAIARNEGWSIIPCGDILLNEMGLSTQVPVVWSYVSSGPYRTYDVQGVAISFKHTANREMFRLSPKSARVVQALKTIGMNNVDESVVEKLRDCLSEKDRKVLLLETSRVTSWIYEVIRKLTKGGSQACRDVCLYRRARADLLGEGDDSSSRGDAHT